MGIAREATDPWDTRPAHGRPPVGDVFAGLIWTLGEIVIAVELRSLISTIEESK